MKTVRRSVPVVLIFLLIAFRNCFPIASCCVGKSLAGPRVGSMNNTVMQIDDFLYNPWTDSIQYQLSIIGYYGNSWSADGHRGDPLGTGGKWPLSDIMELYRELSVESGGLQKRDLREQYLDFGYIPLWRMNTLGIFGKYRPIPDITTVVQMVYGGDPGKPGTNENGLVGIGEASLQWSPSSVPRFWLRAGNILDAGAYSSLFDQNPLENFLYTGIMGSWAATIGSSTKTVSSIAFGGSFVNATTLRDAAYDYYSHQGYLRAGRQRTYIYVKSSALIHNKVGMKAVGGIQFVPADSSPDVLGRMYTYLAGRGAFAGLEASWFGEDISHTAVFTYARGDAALGWGVPDYTIHPFRPGPVNPDHSAPVQEYSFSREGSSCFNLLYWLGYKSDFFNISGGFWYNGRIPAKNSVVLANPTPGNIRQSLPQSALKDSMVTLSAEPFHAIRFSIVPSIQFGFSPFFFGIRYDNITYLTPNAHTNMIEYERDQTLQQLSFSNIPLDQAAKVYGPARWDREAVNANIISPMARLDFKEKGGITAAYSMGFYNKPIDRQGRISNFHGNFTLGADIGISLKKFKSQKQCPL
jgi:hypothetical protein